MTPLEAALVYLKHYKFSVIPMKPNKKEGSYIQWKPYQERLPTEKEVRYWFTLWDDALIAVVTGKMSDLCCVDFDSYKMSNQEKQETSEIFKDSLLTPTINTPQGGKHFLFRYNDCAEGLTVCQSFIKNVDFQGEGGITIMPPSRNGKGDYSWQDGLDFKSTSILNLPIYIKEKIINKYIYLQKQNKNTANPYNSLNTLKTLNLFSEEGLRDSAFFHTANCMIKGGLEPAYCFEVLETLLEKANSNCKDKYTKEEIYIKIKSALERVEHRRKNLSEEIRGWISLNDLNFSLKDLKSDLKLLNSPETNILYVTINSLCDQGVIEKDGKIPGIYRKKENNVNFVDISQVPDLEFISLRWPLGVEDYVRVSPKSISIIAGDTDAGKSAFLSCFCNLNLDTNKIIFFSSEMTAGRFKNRVSTLQRPIKEWGKLFFTEDKTSNFHDSIDPDAINIIDYLELDPGRVFDVSIYIRKIFEKLNKGIAIIALQKKRGEDLAYGRDWTMQKAEFYMTLSRDDEGNIAKIEKAKNWASIMANPVGLKKRFLLFKGINFYPDKSRPDWFKGEGNEEKDYL